MPSPPRLTAAAAADDGAKMKGLFKSKPRTPVDIVRQTREGLVQLDLQSGSRSGGDAKREEKVRSGLAPLSRDFVASIPQFCPLLRPVNVG